MADVQIKALAYIFLIFHIEFHPNESARMTSYLMELRGLIGNRLLLLPSVAAIIHDHAGNLLLQEKASGEGWSLPAGAIEPGETPQEAIIREVREETGFTVCSTSIVSVFGGRDFRYTYPNGDQVEYVVTLFRCQVFGDQGSWTDKETRSLGYFARDAMPPLALPYPVPSLFS
nr:NUDIX domain-containing protein [Rhizobium leguminosarum]